MRILLLTDSYPPEVRSASHLMFELASGLTERKHEVTVVTASPGYNLAEGVAVPRTRFVSTSIESGVKVIRVWTLPIHKVGLFAKGIGQLGLIVSMFVGGLLAGPIDVIFIYSPPLTIGVAGLLLGRAKSAPYVLNVQDLFPQNAIDLGVLKGQVPIKFFETMELWVYKHSTLITLHSRGNAQHVLAKTHGTEKIEIVSNWVDLDEFPKNTDSALRNSLGLEGAFVVLFAGVMGYAQDLDIVIDAARILQTEKPIVFLLVGDGIEKQRLQSKVKKMNLKNVQFLPFVSKDRYPELVAASDVGLVTLRKSMKTPVVPSKILGYMAAGKPCVASLNPESDAISIVKNAGCGIVVPAEDPKALADAVKWLFQSQKVAREMGDRGRHYAEEHFSKCAALDRYEQLLSNCFIQKT